MRDCFGERFQQRSITLVWRHGLFLLEGVVLNVTAPALVVGRVRTMASFSLWASPSSCCRL
jgi:hypothetical protein